MKNILLIHFIFCFSTVIGQITDEYSNLIAKADSLYRVKKYKESGFYFSNAFKSLGWKGSLNDRYNAACSWALAGEPDSAFVNLDRIVRLGNYIDYEQITTDSDLNILHNDSRWKPLIALIKSNKKKAEANFNKPLTRQLEQIYRDDQKYRSMVDSVQKNYGGNSKQMNSLSNTMRQNDSKNLIIVKEILDKHGWLGKDEVGENGNITLFLVIQHSDLKTQEKYLPMMKEAVKNGKASAADLALLIDRVEIGNGRPQIYGSQLTATINGKITLEPIIDEPNVNNRRAEVGLEPLERYLKYWDIEYKLPEK